VLTGLLVCLVLVAIPAGAQPGGRDQRMAAESLVQLPPAETQGGRSVEQALQQRRSVRRFAAPALTLAEVGQLLWAAQGITDPQGLRTAPSAGALYPLEVFLVAGNVEDLPAGVYRYQPARHALERLLEADLRAALARAALGQTWVRKGAAVAVFAALYRRTTAKYGERGIRYAHIEAGHAAQNLFLQAVSLELNSVVVGAFDDDAVRRTLGLPGDHVPLILMPLGR
jgi:SagB-type dehydrogenase family enzyme